jgi:hypothetical protein
MIGRIGAFFKGHGPVACGGSFHPVDDWVRMGAFPD